MKHVLLFAVVFWVQQGFGGPLWPPQAMDLIENFSGPIKDPYVFTLWGGCQAPRRRPQDLPIGQLNFQIPLSTETSKKLPVLFYGEKQHKRALTLYIPGVFGNSADPQATNVAHALMAQSHVAVFPNPLGTDFVGLDATDSLGDVEEEGQLYYQAMIQLLQELKHKGFQWEEVHLMGVSHGAFLAAQINFLDTQSQQIFDGKITLINPPFQLYQSLMALDELMDQHDEEYFSFTPEITYADDLIKFCHAHLHPILRPQSLRLAQYLAAHLGFRQDLLDTINLYLDLRQQGPYFRSRGGLSRLYRNWYKEQRFVTFLEEHFPAVAEKIKGPAGELLYWINQAHSAGNDRIRLLTCEDDIINPRPLWPRSPWAVKLKSCGHFGLQGMKWWEDFLASLYQVEKGKFHDRRHPSQSI